MPGGLIKLISFYNFVLNEFNLAENILPPNHYFNIYSFPEIAKLVTSSQPVEQTNEETRWQYSDSTDVGRCHRF